MVPVTSVSSKGPVAVPTGSALSFLSYALAERMAREGLDRRSGRTGSGFSVVIRTLSPPSAFAVKATSARAAGTGLARAAWERAVATAAGVTAEPSWKVASRRVNSQERSFSRRQEAARAGAAAPLASSAVRPSVTPRRLRMVASAPYGERFSAGGKARATRRRVPSWEVPAAPSPPEAKQPASTGARTRARSGRSRRTVYRSIGISKWTTSLPPSRSSRSSCTTLPSERQKLSAPGTLGSVCR